MQYLIDAIVSRLRLEFGYFERPYPGDPDWEKPILNADTSWHDRDLSGIVPVGTRAVLFYLRGEASASGRSLLLRPNNTYTGVGITGLRMQIANRGYDQTKVLSIGDDRTFQTKVSATSWTVLELVVAGWWMSSAVLNCGVNRGDPSSPDFETGDLIKDGAWHILNLTGIVPIDTAFVYLRCKIRHSSVNQRVRFRSAGNLNAVNVSEFWAREPTTMFAFDAVVPTRGKTVIEYNAGNVLWDPLDIVVKGWSF